VYAFDREGKSTLLGSPVIQVGNAAATKPFGTLDTPQSGATINGSQYTVWGWALTPQPALIPLNGSTLWVFVDGVSLGQPVYNLYRQDVSSLFPGLRNTNGPVGYYYLDTTKLANGMHSIAWSVTDNLGRVEGIGSRLFFVLNSGTAPMNVRSLEPRRLMQSFVPEGVWLRTGYDPHASLTKVENSAVEVDQGNRIELHVPDASAVEFNGNTALPVGATFDSGALYWQIDPAFIAAYELKFRNADGAEIARVCVRSKACPDYRNSSDTQELSPSALGRSSYLLRNISCTCSNQ
jgi:hypothetical protein